MIIIFHGDNQIKLREEFLRLKKDYSESSFWEKELDALPAYLSSPSFFSSGKKELIAIEDPDLRQLTNERIGKWENESKDIVLLFSRRLTPREVPKLKGAQVTTFWDDAPKNVFPFLDAILAKERRLALREMHRLKSEGIDPDFLIKMIGWQLRILTRVREKATAGISPYVAKKLERLAGSWSTGDLRRAFSLLLSEDLRQKKGKKMPLDFLVAKLTERFGS